MKCSFMNEVSLVISWFLQLSQLNNNIELKYDDVTAATVTNPCVSFLITIL